MRTVTVSPGLQWPGCEADLSRHLMLRLRMNATVPPFPLLYLHDISLFHSARLLGSFYQMARNVLQDSSFILKLSIEFGKKNLWALPRFGRFIVVSGNKREVVCWLEHTNTLHHLFAAGRGKGGIRWEDSEEVAEGSGQAWRYVFCSDCG